MHSEEVKLSPLSERSEGEDKSPKHRRPFGSAGIIILVLLSALGLAYVLGMQFFSLIQISNRDFSSGFSRGDVLMLLKKQEYERGDLIAVRFQDKILVRRLIALGGDEVLLDEEGRLKVEGRGTAEMPDTEPVKETGEINFPYRVPDHGIFVLNDDHGDLADSRAEKLSAIKEEDIIGKALFRLLPISKIGRIS